jgi:hypothetical protein
VSPYQLGFLTRVVYPSSFDITLSIAISANSQDFYEVKAKLDSSSVFCILQRRYAKLLELDLEAGTLQHIRTATGSFLAYGHDIILSIEGIEWHATVYFAEDEFFPVNVVGRVGFLDRLRIGLVDYEQTLYLSAYDD